MPGYITDSEEIERIVDENFQAECGRYTDEELVTFIRVQDDSEQLAADMQSRRLAGEDITKLPRYREYLFSQVGMEPTTMGFEGGGTQYVKYYDDGEMYTVQDLVDAQVIELVSVKKGGADK